MTDTMKERIARAIIECDGRLLRSNDVSAVEARAYASAVLVAMREPTPYVVALTLEAVNLWQNDEGEDEDIFRTMIDAMQSEGKE